MEILWKDCCSCLLEFKEFIFLCEYPFPWILIGCVLFVSDHHWGCSPSEWQSGMWGQLSGWTDIDRAYFQWYSGTLKDASAEQDGGSAFLLCFSRKASTCPKTKGGDRPLPVVARGRVQACQLPTWKCKVPFFVRLHSEEINTWSRFS